MSAYISDVYYLLCCVISQQTQHATIHYVSMDHSLHYRHGSMDGHD